MVKSYCLWNRSRIVFRWGQRNIFWILSAYDFNFEGFTAVCSDSIMCPWTFAYSATHELSPSILNKSTAALSSISEPLKWQILLMFSVLMWLMWILFMCQLHQACEGAALRGSRVISAEDILFLMRKDKVNKTHQAHKTPSLTSYPSLTVLSFCLVSRGRWRGY